VMAILVKQSLHDVVYPQLPEIGVCLSASDKQDGLSCDVCHGQCRANFVVLSISS
jgi:hypothetical protein